MKAKWKRKRKSKKCQNISILASNHTDVRYHIFKPVGSQQTAKWNHHTCKWINVHTLWSSDRQMRKRKSSDKDRWVNKHSGDQTDGQTTEILVLISSLWSTLYTTSKVQSKPARQTETEMQYLLCPFLLFYPPQTPSTPYPSHSLKKHPEKLFHDNPKHVIASAYFWILSARKHMQIKRGKMLLWAN